MFLSPSIASAAGRDEGTGSVLVVALAASVLLLTGLALPLNQALTMRQRVANAADAAALAAADTASGLVAGVPCENAAEAARLNGAGLAHCTVDGAEVRVTASLRVLGVTVTVAARAGPPSDDATGRHLAMARGTGRGDTQENTHEGRPIMAAVVTQVDPPGMHKNPAFAQGMVAPAGATLYVGGQNGTDSSGELLTGLGAQTEQALRNVLAILAEAGTGPENVVKLTIYLATGVDPHEAYAATDTVWGARRTAVTVLAVTPARADALVEIEAIAAVP